MGKCCSEKETAYKEKNKGTSLKAHFYFGPPLGLTEKQKI